MSRSRLAPMLVLAASFAFAHPLAWHEARAEEEAAAGGEHGGEAAKPPALVELKPISIPLLGATGPRQIVALAVTIKPSSDEASKKLAAEKPQLVDAIFTELYGSLEAGTVMKGDVIDVTLLKPRLQQIVGKVAAPEDVSDILIQDLMQRRLAK